MDTLRQDIRYALRGMLKHPGFTAAVIVTLGLGIGANTAIFSVVHAVLLKPIPYPADAPDDVLVIAEKTPTGGRMGVSYPTYRDWVDLVEFSSVGEMAAYINRTASLSGREQPVRLPIRYTSASYFDIQGVQPLRGRFYTADEDVAGGPSVVVLNHPLWQGRFGGREEIIGEDVTLDGETATVIGILPDDFELMPEERFYAAFMPWADANHSKDRGDHQGVNVLTRTVPGATFEQARAELDAIAKRFEAEYPDSNSGVGLFVEPLVERRLREYRSILWLRPLDYEAPDRLVVLRETKLPQFPMSPRPLWRCPPSASMASSVAQRTQEMGLRLALGADRSHVFRLIVGQGMRLAAINPSMLGTAMNMPGSRADGHGRPLRDARRATGDGT